MNPPKQTRQSQSEAIEATAAAWLARRDQGFTAEEEAEFALWRFSDPRHTAAVDRLEAAWGALDALRDFRPEARAHPDADMLAAPARAVVVRFPRMAVVGAIAAVVMLGLFAWSLVVFNAGPRRQAIVHPGPERLALEDGSVVELNTGAKVEVAFTPAERTVRLVRGEAHFTVAKNPARPFVVSAGQVSVRAVGTAFSVSLAAESVAVLVTEGRVQLSTPPPVAIAGAAPPAELPRLDAGQRAIIASPPADSPAGGAPALPVEVRQLTPVEVERSLSWQGIRLEFVDMRLSDIVTDFNRYNHRKLVIGDRETGAMVVGGNFRADNVEAFVRLLEASFGVEVVREGEHIELRRPRG